MKTNYLLSRISLFVCLQVLTTQLYAIEVRGRVVTKEGTGLEFASLHVKDTNIGTTTNEEGYYSINLRPGNYKIIFQYVGFKPKTVDVAVGQEALLVDVVLESESLMLKEVLVEVSDNDPAYGIIREAQAKRRYYLKEEVKSYTCQAYVKGIQRLDKKPKSFMGVKIEADTGVVYFSESLSEYSYEQPNKYKEVMIASKVSGDNRAFSLNQATDTWVNLYENISAEEITERGLVSPIASNAMAYYRYRLEGYYQDGKVMVNKIRVIPRRKSAPAYQGFIYITEDTWRIHSTDLYLQKGAIEFVDSIAVQQVYTPIKEGIWLPLSQKVSFDLKGFGFKGSGYFTFVYSRYEVEPNFPEKHFTGEIIKIEEEANKKDSLFWNEIRPVPLTIEEAKDYQIKDSIRIRKETKVYKDSVDQKHNRLSIGNVLWAGYTYRNSYKNKKLSFQPVLSTFQFNTVEGLVTDFGIEYRKTYKDKRYFTIEPGLRYGFSGERFYTKLKTTYLFNAFNASQISLEGGRYIAQISRATSISPFFNTIYTLLNEKNLIKLYEKSYGKVRYQQELWPGIKLYSSLEYAERNPLQNTSDYVIRDVENREYTSNVPETLEGIDASFTKNQALTFGAVLLFNFGQKYASYPNRKYVMESKYPTFKINYRKGIKLLGSDVDYDFLTLGVSDAIGFGLAGQSKFNVEAGKFLNQSQMTFVDYRHFSGNQTVFLQSTKDGFQLLDYYKYSTKDAYFKGHYAHHFNGLLFNMLPLLKRLKWQTVVGANYLYTKASGHYLELSAGIEHIFKVLRIDFVTALQEDQRLNSGVRIGLGF